MMKMNVFAVFLLLGCTIQSLAAAADYEKEALQQPWHQIQYPYRHFPWRPLYQPHPHPQQVLPSKAIDCARDLKIALLCTRQIVLSIRTQKQLDLYPQCCDAVANITSDCHLTARFDNPYFFPLLKKHCSNEKKAEEPTPPSTSPSPPPPLLENPQPSPPPLVEVPEPEPQLPPSESPSPSPFEEEPESPSPSPFEEEPESPSEAPSPSPLEDGWF